MGVFPFVLFGAVVILFLAGNNVAAKPSTTTTMPPTTTIVYPQPETNYFDFCMNSSIDPWPMPINPPHSNDKCCSCVDECVENGGVWERCVEAANLVCESDYSHVPFDYGTYCS